MTGRAGTRLFHLGDPEALVAASERGDADWRPPSLAAEGFVHLSFAPQLAGTLAAHFGSAERLWLLEVELASPGLRVEPSRGGADFPHLYRALAWREVVRAWALERVKRSWGLPLLGETPALDDPPGGPFPPGKRGN